MYVRDIGPHDARIMIVGEAPGEMEDRVGQPFVGQSGSVLKQMLNHVGIYFHECYVTNVSPKKPPNNDFSYYYSDKSKNNPKKELLDWQAELREKIEKVKPNIVIALGEEAMRAITNKRGITKWRGCLQQYKGTKILPTFHPSYVLRVYEHHVIFEMDMAKALVQSQSKELEYDKVDISTALPLQQTLSWLDVAKRKERVAFDLETIDLHIRCIAIAYRDKNITRAISIPFMKFQSADMVCPNRLLSETVSSDIPASYWNERDEMQLLDKIAEIMESSSVQKVGQNSICFDSPIMQKDFNMSTINHHFDTMHAWHLLYSELPMGLDFLVSALTNYPNYWSEKVTSSDISEWKYNAYDAAATLDISYKIESEIRKSGSWEKYKEIHDLATAIAIMQDRGVLIDVEDRKKIKVEHEKKLDDINRELSKLVGASFNPNSPKQVSELLYRNLRLPMMKKDGKPTTDEAALKKLAHKFPKISAINMIVDYRKTQKLISTFLDMKVDSDNRMRCSYNVSGTKNGRLSSSSNLKGTGGNLQNIPVGKTKGVTGIRQIFIPSAGKKWLKVDLVQAETMVVAAILTRYNDFTLWERYKDPNFDMHSWMASAIYGYQVTKEQKKEREVGKLANHSGNYVAGPMVLVTKAIKEEIAGVDYNIAKRILDKRHQAIPGLKAWWADVEKTLRRTRQIKTCMSRTRSFFGRLDNTTLRDAVAFEPQSIVGDLTNKALVKIELDSSSKLDLLLQVHDELDGEFYPEDEDVVITEVRDAFNIELDVNPGVIEPFVIPVEIKVGKNWRDTTEV